MINHQRQWIAVMIFAGSLLGGCQGVQAEQDAVKMVAAEPKVANVDELSTQPLPPQQSIDNDSENETLPPRGSSFGGEVIRMLLALAVVVALIFVARYLLRRFGVGAKIHRRSAVIDVIATARISPRQQLLLVHIGKRLVLIGSSHESLSRLAEITEPAEVAQLLKAVGGAPAAAVADILKRKLSENNELENEPQERQ